MKCWHKMIAVFLCVMLLAVPFGAFAEDDDPYEETDTTTTTIVPTTTTTTEPVWTTRESSSTATSAPQLFEPPLVKITQETLTKIPAPGEAFTTTVVFHNYSSHNVTLHAGLASFEPSDGLVIEENSASKVVREIGWGDLGKVVIHLRVAKGAKEANQFIVVTYSYAYQTPEGLQQAEITEKLLVKVVPVSDEDSTTAASATPNIIVTDYNYGDTIAAGDAFTLRLQFRNTSQKLVAENIVMSVETGEGITITSASNTYYYSSLGAGQTQSQSIPMRVTINANPEGARIEISFKYEYVDHGTRSSASASERLSVPIYIPDRFTVSTPDMDLIGTQNEELSVSLPYLNKSRVVVNNVSAELIYDEELVECEQPRINLGNFESGKSGTIDFYFTPLEAGDGSVTVKVTYEDELMQEKTMEIDVPYSVEPGYMDLGIDEPFEDMEEESSSFPVWAIILICAGAVLVVVIIILIVRKKKKKKAAEPSVEFDWGTPQEVNTHEDQ